MIPDVAQPRPRVGNWMQTISGRAFWPLDPRPEDVHLVDIAHALSMICRFGGHCYEFYSVAQHSVLVSRAVAMSPHVNASAWRAYALRGLLHDAAEAYIGDMIWPLKASGRLDAYKRIEASVERAIFERFDVGGSHDLIKHFDLVLLATEKRDLMLGSGSASKETDAARATLGSWHCDEIEPLVDRIQPWSQQDARKRFLERFEELTST